MTSPSSRYATADDLPGMAEALALSFHDDPVMEWLLGPEEGRSPSFLPKFFAHEARRLLKHTTVLTDDDHAGASLWAPPGHWKTRFVEVASMAPFMITGMRHRIPSALRGPG